MLAHCFAVFQMLTHFIGPHWKNHPDFISIVLKHGELSGSRWWVEFSKILILVFTGNFIITWVFILGNNCCQLSCLWNDRITSFWKELSCKPVEISGVATVLQVKWDSLKRLLVEFTTQTRAQVLFVKTRLYLSVEHKCPRCTALSSTSISNTCTWGSNYSPALLHWGHSYVRMAFPCSTW